MSILSITFCIVLELQERANKMNVDEKRINQEYFEIISLLEGNEIFTQESGMLNIS